MPSERPSEEALPPPPAPKVEPSASAHDETPDRPVADLQHLGPIGLTDEHGGDPTFARELEWRLKSIIDGTNVGTWEWNVQTGETRFNERWASIVGHRLEDLQPTDISTWASFAHPDDLTLSNELLELHFSGELPFYDFECRMRHRDGHWVWVHDRGRVFTWTADGAPEWMFGTHQEISERRADEAKRIELEAQLLRSQKLESLGTLAGGIAHDFNNILSAVRGFTELAHGEVDADSEVAALLDEALRGVDRAAGLTRQMLAYSGRGTIVIDEVDVNELIRETTELVRGAISRLATISFDLADGLPRVTGDPSQLQQLVMNLVLNASEALGDRNGHVTVRTCLEQWDGVGGPLGVRPLRADPSLLAPGEYIAIDVVDDGEGIPPEIEQRMLDPFFTTKQHGRGLGMAAVAGILRGHGGGLLISTVPGEGTTLRAMLPPTSSNTTHARSPSPTRRRVDRPTMSPDLLAGRTILIADDETPLRELGRTILGRQGAHVLSAADGVEALAHLERLGDEIDAVVLDLTMPRMDGATCLAHIRTLHPDLPVVLTSGFSADWVDGRRGSRHATSFLQKPYSARSLVDHLVAALA